MIDCLYRYDLDGTLEKIPLDTESETALYLVDKRGMLYAKEDLDNTPFTKYCQWGHFEIYSTEEKARSAVLSTLRRGLQQCEAKCGELRATILKLAPPT